MKQAHAAGLTEGTKLVFPAAGWQHTLMKKEFTPEEMLFGHNTLYFANPNASPLAKEFVAWYEKAHQDYPEWEADRAYFAIASYKEAIEKAMKAKGGSWPSQDDVINSLVGLSIESLGGKSSWRKDHIADQTFVQGLTTHKNSYDFVTLGNFGRLLHRVAKAAGRKFLGMDQVRPVQSLTRQTGLDVRVCKYPRRRRISRRRFILGRGGTSTRLRCSKDRQFGVRFVLRARRLFRHYLYQLRDAIRHLIVADISGIIVSGILLGFIGPPIERILRSVYGRDESFQLLLTFALVLIFQDVFKFIWGANPRSLDSAYLIYGTLRAGDFSMPVYNLLVILAAIAIAGGLVSSYSGPITAASCARPRKTTISRT